MQKIIISLFLLFTFLLPLSNTFAATCSSSSEYTPCTTSKKDFYLKNIGKFKYLDWTHSITEKVLFQGKTQFYSADVKSEKVGYSIKGDDTVNYYVSFFDFKTEQEATELFSKYVQDNNNKSYKNKKGDVYLIDNRSIVWLNENVMVMISANSDAPKKKTFLKKAFTIYSKKLPPQKTN